MIHPSRTDFPEKPVDLVKPRSSKGNEFPTPKLEWVGGGKRQFFEKGRI